MNLSCCICIFVITNFVLGSSNKKSYKDSYINKLSRSKSGLDGSNSVATYEPKANDENTDVEADKDDDGDANKDDDGDTNKDDDGDANKDDDGDANTDDDGDANKDDDGDTNTDDDGDANKDDDGDANKNDDGDANKDDDGDTNTDDDGDANKDDDGDANKDDDGDANTNNASGEIFPFRNGIVPYYVDRDSYDEIIFDRIVAATKIIEKESCIKFVYLDNKIETKDKDQDPDIIHYLNFTNPDKKRECDHSVTLTDQGNQTFTLGYDCMQMRDIIHSLMHILGFRDEVTHPLRDSHVRVLWENIQRKYRPLFLIQKANKYEEVSEYDMMSIMHFYPTAYSINGAPTIIPLTPGEVITPSNQLSFLDKKKLRSAFKHACNRRKVSKLLGTCINAIQGDDTAGCTGGETDNGGGSSKFKNGGGSSKFKNGGGSSKFKSGASSESDKNMNLIGIGEDKKESLIGIDNDKIEALSGSDRDKIQVLSETDKDRIQVLSGSETDKVGSSKIRLRKKSKNQIRNINFNINKKTSTVGYLRSYRKYMY